MSDSLTEVVPRPCGIAGEDAQGEPQRLAHTAQCGRTRRHRTPVALLVIEHETFHFLLFSSHSGVHCKAHVFPIL